MQANIQSTEMFSGLPAQVSYCVPMASCQQEIIPHRSLGGASLLNKLFILMYVILFTSSEAVKSR